MYIWCMHEYAYVCEFVNNRDVLDMTEANVSAFNWGDRVGLARFKFVCNT